MTGNLRLFIAINLPEIVRHELSLIRPLHQHPFIRWTLKENLHITVRFIGEIPEVELQRFKERIRSISSKISTFKMTTEKLKVVRKNRKPVMIWACLQDNESFNRLALQFREVLPGDDSKTQVPHITLARITRGKKVQIPDLPEIQKTAFEVISIELMKSMAGNTAPVYEVVEKFKLG